MTQAQSFTTLAAQARTGRADIPDHWKQGRTAYGGLTAALMLERSRAVQDGLPPLRSALVNFTGPVTDAPTLNARLLRQGRNVATVQADAAIDGATVGTAVFSFGGTRESSVTVDLPAADAPAPEDCKPFLPPQVAAFVPAFLHNFETRLIAGARPVTGAAEGFIHLWARHADPAARSGESALLCLADVLPPAAMPLLRTPGPVSSMNWICNILRSPDTDDGWYRVEARLSAARDGYSSQVMRIWNARGELVIEGMQSIVIFA